MRNRRCSAEGVCVRDGWGAVLSLAKVWLESHNRAFKFIKVIRKINNIINVGVLLRLRLSKLRSRVRALAALLCDFRYSCRKQQLISYHITSGSFAEISTRYSLVGGHYSKVVAILKASSLLLEPIRYHSTVPSNLTTRFDPSFTSVTFTAFCYVSAGRTKPLHVLTVLGVMRCALGPLSRELVYCWSVVAQSDLALYPSW
jgi:hypothetical protein